MQRLAFQTIPTVKPLARFGTAPAVTPQQVNVLFETKALKAKERQSIEQNKMTFVDRAWAAREHAAKNKQFNLAPFSNRQFASYVELECGTTGLGTNIEASAEELVCGERSATTVAINKAIQEFRLPTNWSGTPEQQGWLQSQLKVKRLVMASTKPIEDEVSSGRPCGDCLNWMKSDRFFSPKTQSMVFFKNPQADDYTLRVRTVQDLWRGAAQSSLTARNLSELPIQLSPGAKKAFKQLGYLKSLDTWRLIQNELGTVKATYDATKDKANGQPYRLAGATFFIPSENQPAETPTTHRIFIQPDFYWAKRFAHEGDMRAVEIGVDTLQQEAPETPAPYTVLLSYYGDGPPASPKSLGQLAQKWVTPNSLVAQINRNRIEVKTILETMPYMHVSVVTKPGY